MKENEGSKENKTRALAKNPLKGGIPAKEKKTTVNENAHVLFVLDKLDKLDKKTDLIFSL